MKVINYLKTWLGLRQLAGIGLGLVAGYAYWYFYGCTEGCTITGTALNSSLYFGMMGYFASGWIAAKNEERQSTAENKNETTTE